VAADTRRVPEPEALVSLFERDIEQLRVRTA